MRLSRKAILHPEGRHGLGGRAAMIGAAALRLLLEGISARAQAIGGTRHDRWEH
ncbi:hypothetical protein [Sphingobium sp. CFD-1]|uniref:hypothetical protein n=1 Tax=Sphingobium sp. CFD-1 TaxID=2878545 RepID=UPI00214C38B0|nr:hypothetical protein [Sphingobium sp. CFD-1]